MWMIVGSTMLEFTDDYWIRYRSADRFWSKIRVCVLTLLTSCLDLMCMTICSSIVSLLSNTDGFQENGFFSRWAFSSSTSCSQALRIRLPRRFALSRTARGLGMSRLCSREGRRYVLLMIGRMVLGADCHHRVRLLKLVDRPILVREIPMLILWNHS
jgi:hypothetical protein